MVGGSDALWFGALLPRVHAYVPTGTILEIGAGYGRWTNYLKVAFERPLLTEMLGYLRHPQPAA